VGLKKAKGDFIQFLDSDDVLLPDKFRVHINHIEQNKSIDICVSAYKLFTTKPAKAFDTAISLKPYNCTLKGFLYSWNTAFVFPPVCYFVRRDFLSKNNIVFNENINAFEDWIFLIQLCLKNAIFCIHKSTLALYRRHDSNMTNDFQFMSKNMIKASFLVYELLPADMKDEFINNIDSFISLTLRDILKVDYFKLKANSVEYSFGKALIRPFRFLNHLASKVIRKLKKLV